ncbi:MAG: hypothetical protein K9G67_07930 [Bacteroidales bacterium]|nr:hypothetical protein [Bacteroidales bacterium]MCF8343497.1 hypothetical protein [Bacteroidales bacterium]MCF8349750.1 hypothetical protein [Bacteroidales bacterium]MCF8376269.1 hypothetical protein [Bacteroidales bacterium]MCF8401564.1 hypothetical protein [Bacteroidales bacterium]
MSKTFFNKDPKRNEEHGFEWGTLMTDELDFVSLKDQSAHIAGRSVNWWVANFGLPLHIFYAPKIVNNVRAYKKVFEEHYPKGEIRFAGKVNPHPSVFNLMRQEGIGADVVSMNEMNAALMGGIDPLHIDVNGNAKSNQFIDKALEHNMFFVADSYEEMQIINKRAESIGRKARTILRVAGFHMDNVTDANVFTAGVWSKFGENINNIPGIIRQLDQFPYLDFQGFHSHIGSQITEPDAYWIMIGKLLELGALLNEAGGHFRLLNIGGGFPFNYVGKKEWEYLQKRVREGYIQTKEGHPEETFVWNNELGGIKRNPEGTVDTKSWSGEKMYSDYPKYHMLEEVLKGNTKVNGQEMTVKEALKKMGEPTVVIEPGRSIAEDCGVTLSKVSHVRKVAGHHHLTTLEASVTSFATAMLLPPVNPWTVINHPLEHDEKPFETFLAGDLCYSGDIISKYKIFLQRKPRRGEVLCCYNTGAYDPSFFAANTNAFPRPTRVLTDKDHIISVIKKRDSFRDIFSMDKH